jgi:hypothetical protein
MKRAFGRTCGQGRIVTVSAAGGPRARARGSGRNPACTRVLRGGCVFCVQYAPTMLALTRTTLCRLRMFCQEGERVRLAAERARGGAKAA